MSIEKYLLTNSRILLNNFYRGTQKISIIHPDKSNKTTEELVDEIVTKLT